METRNNNISRRLCEAPVIRKISEDERTIEFVASDNSVDSYGTIIPVDKWDLGRYQKNGVVGYMHDVYGDDWFKSADPDDVIGKGVAFVDNDQLIIRVTFEPADLNAKADKIFRKVQFGSINAVSVGFAPTQEGHWGDETRGENADVYYYDGQELLEVSVVNIPSNANAIRRSFGEAEMEKLRAEKPQPAADPEPAPAPEPEPEPAPEPEDTSALDLAIAKARGAMV